MWYMYSTLSSRVHNKRERVLNVCILCIWCIRKVTWLPVINLVAASRQVAAPGARIGQSGSWCKVMLRSLSFIMDSCYHSFVICLHSQQSIELCSYPWPLSYVMLPICRYVTNTPHLLNLDLLDLLVFGILNLEELLPVRDPLLSLFVRLLHLKGGGGWL